MAVFKNASYCLPDYLDARPAVIVQKNGFTVFLTLGLDSTQRILTPTSLRTEIVSQTMYVSGQVMTVNHRKREVAR